MARVLTNNEFVDISGFEGIYRVSREGQVVSLHSGHPIILKPKLDHYLRVQLSVGGVRKYASVHRLVAETFLPNPDRLPCINHKDGDKLNNFADNLEWVTFSGNSNHAVETGLFDHISGSKSHLSTHEEIDIAEVVRLLQAGHNPSQVSKITNVSRPSCSKINLGTAWRPFLRSLGIKSFPIFKTSRINQNSGLITEEQKNQMLILRRQGYSQKNIASSLGLGQSTVCRYLNKMK
jgi:hypothetical protein